MPSPAKRSTPLYVRARKELVDRIRSGAWRPGELIPNEFELADEFGMSQGTVRKALDSLAADHLVIRRQGRGTFVVEHTPAHVQFRFFNLFDDAGRQILPESRDARIRRMRAKAGERRALALTAGDDVVRIERIRLRRTAPFIIETISLPAALFPGIEAMAPLPNTLYDLFQKSFGVLIIRADEQISPLAAGPEEARALEIAEGTPLLRVERVSFGLDDAPVELRVSLVHLPTGYYFSRVK